MFNNLVVKVFRQLLLQIISVEWPTEILQIPTRMSKQHPEALLETQVFRSRQKAVCVDVARAGMVPSQVFFDELNTIVDAQSVRQDHVFASRMTSSEGQVTHTHLAGSKIGGDVDEALVMIPDPMGATGNSICEVISHYKKEVPGKAKKFIAAHMMITPEYIRKVTTAHPDVLIYAVRLDRGFSSPQALAQEPGALWEQEKGLDDNQYIVPGAGGVGELINNSFV
jgi:uracil phosphoribosyltransferase